MSTEKTHAKLVGGIEFPQFAGIRCLMMPYIQGDPESVPASIRKGYEEILETISLERGKVGFLTIDESEVVAGNPHRGERAKHGRALHTEAGKLPGVYAWGGGTTWGGSPIVTLEPETQIILANSLNDSCAVWNARHEDTSEDGDIGHVAVQYPLDEAILMKAGQVLRIGILTPHESLPVKSDGKRQFLRIVGQGVHGREHYFTENALVKAA